ncbi:hypothetical protein L9F63_016708 [Diploptera punctata]|uniref:Uncharacterized protein n=1 Tax=Diploptera punctata TaxID=6984 RepID=A0AAD8A0D6_DIPPU|nr:hypothetical protein L9F63_016708 [Diploptera punctata]
MSFPKAPIQRFNENNGSSAPQTKYFPQKTYSYQKVSRIDSPTFLNDTQRSSSSIAITNNIKRCGRSESVDTRMNSIALPNKNLDKMKSTSRSKIPSPCKKPQNHPMIRKPTSSFIDMSSQSQNVSIQNRNIPKPAANTNDKQNKKVYEMQYFTKKKRLSVLKKELLSKQKSLLDLFSSMSDLREKVLETTGKDLGPLEEFKLVDLGSLITGSNEVHSQKTSEGEGAGEDLTFTTLRTIGEIDNGFLTHLEKKLQEIPEINKQLFQTLIVQTISSNEWMKKLKDENKITIEGEGNQQQFDNHLNEGENLVKKLDEKKNLEEQAVKELIQDIKKKLRHYGSLEKADDDKHKLNQERLEIIQSENNDLVKKVKFLTEELENERDKSNTLKDRKSTVDIQLKGVRQKLRDMEQKLSTDEIRIVQLLSQMKVLEGQLKTKEATFDHKAKELQKVNKTTGEQMAKLEKQRNIHEARINELKKELSCKETEALAVIEDLQNKLKDAQQKSEEADKLRITAESELETTKARMLEIEEKGKQLTEMAEKTTSIIVTGDESKRSEREVDLWTELNSTRELLESAEKQIKQLNQEKNEFMEIVKQAAQEDDGNIRNICTMYHTKVIEKDAQIKELQNQVAELSASVSSSQEQNSSLETKLKDLQDIFIAQKEDNTSVGNQLEISELQTKVADLQVTMSQMLKEKEQLENTLIQKQLEVEQRDRIMRGQSNVLRVRDELIALLKEREQRQDEEISSLQTSLELRETSAQKVTEEMMEKFGAMQELCSTLENKQILINRLEKHVQKLEEQNDKGEARRIRYEARITQLEQALQETNQRGNKFLLI